MNILDLLVVSTGSGRNGGNDTNGTSADGLLNQNLVSVQILKLLFQGRINSTSLLRQTEASGANGGNGANDANGT